ncbi:MAG: hypothetical protein NVS2B16_32010 [Chloroflexota bacterium]
MDSAIPMNAWVSRCIPDPVEGQATPPTGTFGFDAALTITHSRAADIDER